MAPTRQSLFLLLLRLLSVTAVWKQGSAWFFSSDQGGAAKEQNAHESIPHNSNATRVSNVPLVNLSNSAFSLDDYKSLLEEPYRSYPCTPQGVHIAQKDNVHYVPVLPNETDFHNHTTVPVVSMTISFTLDREQCAKARPKIIYRQGFHPEQTLVVDQKPIQFNFTSSVNATGLFLSDWIYHVTIPKLKGGFHRYYYHLEVEADNEQRSFYNKREEASLGISTATSTHDMLRLGRRHTTDAPLLIGKTPKYSFVTPPLPNQPTSIALVGDLGQTINSTKTMQHIRHDTLSQDNKNPVTLLVIAGDMSYADSDPHRWTSWFKLMEPLTRLLTMHVAAGNHEIECDNATMEIFKQYEYYFRNPNPIDKAEIIPITQEYRQTLYNQSCSTPSEFQGHYNYGNAFYSFTHGSVHFIVLSSYSDSRKGSRQFDWLLEELSFNVNRTLTPWIVVSFHVPLYTTFVGHVNELQSRRMREAMEPLFVEFGVNLVITGHDHGYMRTHPLLVNGVVDPTNKAPIYLTLGAGGNREHHSKGYRNETGPEEFVAARDLEDYGYGNLFIMNATHAILNWVRDGVVKDGIDDKNVMIINHHAPLHPPPKTRSKSVKKPVYDSQNGNGGSLPIYTAAA